MRTTRLIAVLVALAAIAMVTTEASAMYHAGMGRFLSRDPGAGNANRIGAGDAAPVGGFIPRDPTGTNQYADGMNLYQYVGSAPRVFLDPTGLKRLQYSYRYAVVVPEKDTGYFSSMQYGKTVQVAKTFGKLLHTKVEDLLWAYGVNAWHRHPRNYDGPETCGGALGIREKHVDGGIFWDTRYDLYDVENKKEWRFLGTYRGIADDIIVHVPGNIGWGGKVWSTSIAAHDATRHVIAVSGKTYKGLGAQKKAFVIAHEVLHHFLDVIDPGGPDPLHDTEGVMRPAGPFEGETKGAFAFQVQWRR